MNKSELVKALADQANISLDEATLVVNTFVDSMKDSLLEGGRVEIRGFGSFKVKEYGSYAGRNPRTGEKVAVDPKRLPFFRAGKELKEYLNALVEMREYGRRENIPQMSGGVRLPRFSCFVPAAVLFYRDSGGL